MAPPPVSRYLRPPIDGTVNILQVKIEPKLGSMPYEILHKIVDLALPEASSHSSGVHYNMATCGSKCRHIEFIWDDYKDVSLLFVARNVRQITRDILLERATSIFQERVMNASFEDEVLLFKIQIEIGVFDVGAWVAVGPNQYWDVDRMLERWDEGSRTESVE
ncbi:uncharacterized protein AB675_11765 [Cyphellophora attinorum]|uniref:Uncharacterized protein n=1 Tax=Cyphellophora attinorum TaxID=1664694 RepID=A0A0N1HJQ0_9EURO|nr:uncharacterized protein AB675_11765 [Phialophora attinorum]KPI36756.1 hypothetical protein AB675_11765 [Phialophora attinorum]